MTVITMRKTPYSTETFENVESITQSNGKIIIDNGTEHEFNEDSYVVLIRDMKLEG